MSVPTTAANCVSTPFSAVVTVCAAAWICGWFDAFAIRSTLPTAPAVARNPRVTSPTFGLRSVATDSALLAPFSNSAADVRFPVASFVNVSTVFWLAARLRS
ncbi:Uncharacterised protein [Burkholderia pseudomallei]|nr:Uncharacterised protein [Burkholderia pseudomallei]